MSYTIDQVAQALLDQNPVLGEAIDSNPHASYHAVATLVKPMMRTIGQATGSYVRTNDMVWAIINAHQGTGTSLQLKLD